MKKNNILLIILLIVGISGFIVTDFIIKPTQEEQRDKYQLEQQDAFTHDFKDFMEYKDKYMGNASNIINLNYWLPLGNIPRSNEINSDEFEYIINYKETVWGIGEDKVKVDLIYNATANFALIDNLQSITFNFTGDSYSIERIDVQKWYEVNLDDLLDQSVWKNKVQNRLGDKNYVDKFWETNFSTNK